MLFPCRLKTRISTASSATNMRPSAAEYLTSGWVSFQSATLGQICTGDYTATLKVTQSPQLQLQFSRFRAHMSAATLKGKRPSRSPARSSGFRAHVSAATLKLVCAFYLQTAPKQVFQIRALFEGELKYRKGLSEQFSITANFGKGTDRLRKLPAVEKVVSHPADRDEKSSHIADRFGILPAEFAVNYDLALWGLRNRIASNPRIAHLAEKRRPQLVGDLSQSGSAFLLPSCEMSALEGVLKSRKRNEKRERLLGKCLNYFLHRSRKIIDDLYLSQRVRPSPASVVNRSEFPLVR